MKKMIFMHSDISLAIAQRLALYYKMDDAFPALHTTLRPKNQEGDGILNDIIGPRKLSETYASIFNTIRPVSIDPKAAKFNENSTSISIDFDTHLKQIENVQNVMMGVTLVKQRAAAVASSGKNQNGEVVNTEITMVGFTKALKDMLDTMWADTDIISLVLMSRRTVDDIKDELNTTSLSNITSAWLKNLDPAGFFNEMFATIWIGDGTMDKTVDTYRLKLGQMLNGTEVLTAMPQKSQGAYGFTEMMELLSPSKGKKAKRTANAGGVDFAEKMIAHFTALDCLGQVEKVANHFAPVATAQAGKMSLNKDMNQMLLEMSQVEDLLALRVFNSLQAWVALTQRSILPLQRPEALEYVKGLFTNLSATYDMEGIMNDFLSLPIGKMSNSFVNSNEDVTAVTVNGTQLTSIISPYPSTEATDGLDYYAGTVRHVVLSLYPLLKNVELWDLYKKGSLLAGGVTPSFKKVTRSLDNLPVVFSSFGSYAGNRITTLDDYNWSLIFDWGINKFNSSSRTDICYHSAPDDELLLKYSHGQIDYQEYVASYKKKLSGMTANGIGGYDFSQQNIPLVAYRRRMVKHATPFLGVDLGIIKLGATCLLPVPPFNHNAIIKDATSDFLNKEVIGQYETNIEQLPLNFSHTAPIKGEPIPLKDSIIPQFLRISKENFEKSTAIGKTLLNRFVSQVPGKQNSINCSTISEDPFFLTMVSHFFVSPATYVSPKMYELYLRPFLRIDEGQEEVGAILAKEIGVHTYVDGQLTHDRGSIGNRIITTCTSLDRTDPLPRNPYMGHINPEHGTIED